MKADGLNSISGGIAKPILLIIAILADIGVFIACSAKLLGFSTSLSVAVAATSTAAIGLLGVRLFPPLRIDQAEALGPATTTLAHNYAVEISDFSFAYPKEPPVLNIPHMNLEGPRMTAIVGHSGAGKSTFVKLIAAQEQLPYEGSLKVLGQEWKELATGRDAARQAHRRKIGYIPQDYGLLPEWTVMRTIAQDLEDADIPKSEHDARIVAALQEMGIPEHRHSTIRNLSGGQKQRVAIARMLARRVSFIIADEPTANLDAKTRRDVIASLRRAGKDALTLIVTHDPWVANQCDDTVYLEKGTTPGYFGHQPSVAITSGGPGHLDVWTFGPESPLRHQYRGQGNLWSRWADMTSPSADSPIIRLTGGYIPGTTTYEILGVNSDGKASRRLWRDSAWQEWIEDDPGKGTAIEGVTGIRSISMSSGGTSQRTWWATLNDGRIVHKDISQSDKGVWKEMDTPDERRIATLAAGAAPERDQTDLLAIDIWGNTWHRRQAEEWMPWQLLDLPSARIVTITSCQPRHLEMWVVTIDGRILHRASHGGDLAWSDWRSMDTPKNAPVISICGSMQGQGSHDIIVETANRSQWHREHVGSTWGDWNPM